MNRCKLYIFSIFLFLVILPIKVDAISYKSDYIDLNSNIVLETNEFKLDVKYSKLPGLTINAMIVGGKRKTTDVYYYHYIFYYYNIQKEEIGASDGYHSLLATISDTMYSYNNVILESKNMQSSSELSDIKYYKLFVEPVTLDRFNNYKYYGKNNASGLDQIIDLNTIEMTAIYNYTPSDENSSSNNNTVDTYGNGEYALTKYNINIRVNENNTFNITENITAYFIVEKHGILRQIPLINELISDNVRSYNRAKVSDIVVNEPFTSYNKSSYKVIKIGNQNSTLTGSKDYEINYLYSIGKDLIKDCDEFYFNLIGDGWDTTISNPKFTIIMPKSFDASKIGFSSGKYGSTDSSNIEYTVDGNTINGRYNGVLNAWEALTIRLELPKGYFTGSDLDTIDFSNFMTIILFTLPILCAIISIYIWKINGKDHQGAETVEFYPPEGFNSAEIAFLYKGEVNHKDVISLLIYLADKGFLKIEEMEEKVLFSTKKGFKITKIKEYDGNNKIERVFLRGLFNSSDAGDYATVDKLMNYMGNPQQEMLDESNLPLKPQYVTSSDLDHNFDLTLSVIMENINGIENKNKIFSQSTKKMSSIIFTLIILSTINIMCVPSIIYGDTSELYTKIYLMAFIIIFYVIALKEKSSFKSNIISIISLIFAWIIIIFSSFYRIDILMLINYIIGFISIVIMIICYKTMPKRTLYGKEILGKIKGFKNFIEVAEKPKLEELVMQNPTYFYNILPYAYVLGVSNKWIKKFETIGLQSPNWYSGSTSFDLTSFGDFIDSTISTASNPWTLSSSNSGGDSGGNSGGGSSGGGSGGGGGSSW